MISVVSLGHFLGGSESSGLSSPVRDSRESTPGWSQASRTASTTLHLEAVAVALAVAIPTATMTTMITTRATVALALVAEEFEVEVEVEGGNI